MRLAAVGHGLPRGYVPDTHVVRSALGMARDGDLVPEVGRYSSYPNLLPYLLLPVYAGQYTLGRIDGSWAGAGEFGARAMVEPARVHLPARVLVALLGGLTAWATYLGARACGLRAGAWVAAWLVATGLLQLHFSVQERPWAPLVFFAVLAIAPAERYRRDPRPRWMVLSGAAVGLAFATHQAGLPMAGIPALAWLLSDRGWRGADLRRRLLEGAASAAAFVLVALALGHPYLVRHGWTPTETAVRDGDPVATGNVGGQQFVLGASWKSFRHLSSSLAGYDPVVCLLGLVGLAPALRRRGTRSVALFALVFGAVFLTYPNDHVRYVLPLAVLLAWPAGVAAEALLARRGGAWLLAPLLVLPLVQSVRLVWLLRQPDTRAAGEQRIAELPPGSLVAIDHYGPIVDLDRGSLERVLELRERRGETLRTREVHRLQLLEADALEGASAGVPALPVEELLAGDPLRGTVNVRDELTDLGADPGELLRGLGVTHLMLVDRRPGDDVAPPLGELVAGRAALSEVDPARGNGPAREALLPTEMDFPLTGLWAVDRPGPWLGLYELPAP